MSVTRTALRASASEVTDDDSVSIGWTLALERLNELTPPSRTLTVIGTDHGELALPQLEGRCDHVFRQPAARDTGVALYVALAMIKRWHPDALVTITPNRSLRGAIRERRGRPERIETVLALRRSRIAAIAPIAAVEPDNMNKLS